MRPPFSILVATFSIHFFLFLDSLIFTPLFLTLALLTLTLYSLLFYAVCTKNLEWLLNQRLHTVIVSTVGIVFTLLLLINIFTHKSVFIFFYLIFKHFFRDFILLNMINILYGFIIQAQSVASINSFYRNHIVMLLKRVAEAGEFIIDILVRVITIWVFLVVASIVYLYSRCLKNAVPQYYLTYTIIYEYVKIFINAYFFVLALIVIWWGFSEFIVFYWPTMQLQILCHYSAILAHEMYHPLYRFVRLVLSAFGF